MWLAVNRRLTTWPYFTPFEHVFHSVAQLGNVLTNFSASRQVTGEIMSIFGSNRLDVLARCKHLLQRRLTYPLEMTLYGFASTATSSISRSSRSNNLRHLRGSLHLFWMVCLYFLWLTFSLISSSSNFPHHLFLWCGVLQAALQGFLAISYDRLEVLLGNWDEFYRCCCCRLPIHWALRFDQV